MIWGMNIGQLLVFFGALFLIGMNLAIVTKFFYWRIRYPIVGKMLAVVFLLAYIAASARFGSPTWPRITMATIALFVDGLALVWIFATLKRGRSLVPEWLKEDKNDASNASIRSR